MNGEFMNAPLLFFVSLFAYLSFCSPQQPLPTERGSIQSSARSGTGAKTGKVGAANASRGGISGVGTNGEETDGIPNFVLNDRNNAVNTTEYIQTNTDMSWVGGSDCSIHINKRPSDLCHYDFCGDAASNSFLTPGLYTTVQALVAALKAQNKFPSGTCTNAAVIMALLSLTTLDLSGKNLTDISPLQMLTKLTSLNLDHNQISDISALSKMSALQKLYASFNNIVYLNPLTNNLSLVEIYLANNQITSIEALTPLPNLASLDISNNKVASIVNLTHKDIGINVSGNPGIVLEAKTDTATTAIIDDRSCAARLGGDIGAMFSCTWNTANLQFNALINNQPIPKKSTP